MIQALAVFNNPDYVPERWHATLIMIGFSFLACMGNTFGKKLLPAWETLAGLFHVLFFFIVCISILATSEKADNDAVWRTFINGGGWPSDGISFCLGFVTPAFALAGIDTVVHMVSIVRAIVRSAVADRRRSPRKPSMPRPTFPEL